MPGLGTNPYISVLKILFMTLLISGKYEGVGIATGWTAWVRFLAAQDFSVLRSIHTGSGVHLASNPVGTVGLFRGKAAVV
jgi:hypothetical protein